MKAATHTTYGPPDVINVKEVETPVPKENEVLVKVHATTVNRTDCAILRARPFIMRFITGLIKPRKSILGTDFAGTIESVGEKVTSFKAGDNVYGFNDNGLGSQAEYMTISEDDSLALMPDNLAFGHAAASIEGAHYAYNFINKVTIESGQKAIVNGATGAIGSAMVQLLKYYGATITAVCHAKDTDLVTSLGADKVIDYTKVDFTKSGGKYDFVFDAVGKSTFNQCKPLLVSGGIYISSELGPMAQNLFFTLTTKIAGRRKVKFPFPANPKRSILFIKDLIERGLFKPVIDRTYSLDDIIEAYKYVEKGQKIGNVVVKVG